MAVLKALKQSPGALWRNPILLAPVLALVLLQVPMFAAEFIDPIVAALISLGLTLVFVVLMPFFQGGLVGMAEEALDGKTSLGTFFSAGRSNYVSILGAYLLILAINIVLGIGFVLFLFLGVGAAYLGGDGTSAAPLVVVAGGGILLALVYLLFLFFIQFYSQAIVLDDVGAIGGIKRSYAAVRNNLVAAFGYSILVGILGGIFGLIISIASVLVSPSALSSIDVPPLPLEWVVIIGGIGGVLTLILGTFFSIYSVAFYKKISSPVQADSN